MSENRDTWIQNGIDVRGRTISLIGPIDTTAADRVLTGLHLIRGEKPVNLIIHSEGGDDDDCRAIIGAMIAHNAPIHGHVIGTAESAAGWILQCCDWRVMYSHSSLMLHMGESTKDRHSKYIDKLFVDDVLRRMNQKNPEYLRTKLVSNMDNDWYVYPSQALELGLCDQITGG